MLLRYSFVKLNGPGNKTRHENHFIKLKKKREALFGAYKTGEKCIEKSFSPLTKAATIGYKGPVVSY